MPAHPDIQLGATVASRIHKPMTCIHRRNPKIQYGLNRWNKNKAETASLYQNVPTKEGWSNFTGWRFKCSARTWLADRDLPRESAYIKMGTGEINSNQGFTSTEWKTGRKYINTTDHAKIFLSSNKSSIHIALYKASKWNVIWGQLWFIFPPGKKVSS